MDNKLKQRILGGIVIGAVVLIAAPIFLKHNDETITTKTVTINAPIPPLSAPVATPAPELASAPVAPPVQPENAVSPESTVQPENTAPAVQNNSAPIPSDSNTADQTPPLTVTDEQTQSAPTPETTDQTSTPVDASSSASTTTQPAFDPNAPATAPAPSAADATAPAFNPQAAPAPSTPAAAQAPVTAPAPTESQTPAPATTSTPIKTKPVQVAQHTKSASHYSNAWAVQVGSFSKKSNATHLANQLKLRGLPAYTQTTTTSHGKTTRVFIGPEAKHAKAEAIVVMLQRRNHTQAVVVPYSTSLH